MNLACGLIAVSLSFILILLLVAAATLITTLLYSFCVELEIKTTAENIAIVVLTQNSLTLMCNKISANLLHYVRVKCEKLALHIAFEEVSKGKLNHIFKVISF